MGIKNIGKNGENWGKLGSTGNLCVGKMVRHPYIPYIPYFPYRRYSRSRTPILRILSNCPIFHPPPSISCLSRLTVFPPFPLCRHPSYSSVTRNAPENRNYAHDTKPGMNEYTGHKVASIYRNWGFELGPKVGEWTILSP